MFRSRLGTGPVGFDGNTGVDGTIGKARVSGAVCLRRQDMDMGKRRLRALNRSRWRCFVRRCPFFWAAS